MFIIAGGIILALMVITVASLILERIFLGKRVENGPYKD